MTVDEDVAQEKLEVLYAQACRRLIEATEFGRLAFVVDGRPRMVVLNHLVDGDAVLFRTREDAQLAAITDGGREVHVVYEVDSAFPVGRSGWSVIATGLLGRETDDAKRERAMTAIQPWAEGVREVVLRLQVEELSGRKVGTV